jgi:hypothetical protein
VLSLVVLTLAILAAAGAAVARWFPDDGPGEAAVDLGILATGLTVAPVLALGWAGRLEAGTLGTLSALTSATVIGLALGPSPAARGRLAPMARGVLGAPVRLAAAALRGRHIAAVGLAGVVFAGVWTAILAYLAPSSSWDGMWYHDAIVGFAIQEHGFAWVDVPPDLEFVNGYPKTAEMLSLWLVVFWDDRLLELPVSVYGPFATVGFAVLCRRLTGWPLGSAAWGTALFLVPAVVLQLRSSYVDVVFLATFLASAEVLTRPRLASGEVLLAGLGLGLLGGMKGTGLVLVPALGLLALGRLLTRLVSRPGEGVPEGDGGSRRRGRLALAAVLALTLALALMAPFYLRNLLRTGNPAWPVPVSLPGAAAPLPGHWPVDMPLPFSQALDQIFGPAVPGQQFHDVKVGSYGRLLPWLLLPLAALGWLSALREVAARPGRRLASPGAWLLILSLLVVPTLALSPAWYLARFNLHVLAVLLLAVAFALRRPRARPLAHAVLGALILSGLVDLARARPGWEVPFSTALRLAGEPPAVRAAARITPVMGAPETLQALEAELGPGDVIAFTRDFGFPAVLWNRRFSNRLVWVPGSGEAFLRGLDAVHAVWAVAKEGSPQARALGGSPKRWERVGKTSDVNVAYRRRPAAPPLEPPRPPGPSTPSQGTLRRAPR